MLLTELKVVGKHIRMARKAENAGISASKAQAAVLDALATYLGVSTRSNAAWIAIYEVARARGLDVDGIVSQADKEAA
jgi:hypothetical protein